MLGIRIPLNLNVERYIAQFEFSLTVFRRCRVTFIRALRFECLVFDFSRLQVLDAHEADIVLTARWLEHVREVSEADWAIELELMALVSFFRLLVAELYIRLYNNRLQLHIGLLLWLFYFFKTWRTLGVSDSAICTHTSYTWLSLLSILWSQLICVGSLRLRWTSGLLAASRGAAEDSTEGKLASILGVRLLNLLNWLNSCKRSLDRHLLNLRQI